MEKPQPLRGKVFFNGVPITTQQTHNILERLRTFCFLPPLPVKCEAYLTEGLGRFFHDKMIAPVLLMGKGLLPPRKAKLGVGSCWRESLKWPAVKCKEVAAVRLGRQQPGILS